VLAEGKRVVGRKVEGRPARAPSSAPVRQRPTVDSRGAGVRRGEGGVRATSVVVVRGGASDG
jgi:hypothetical protein